LKNKKVWEKKYKRRSGWMGEVRRRKKQQLNKTKVNKQVSLVTYSAVTFRRLVNAVGFETKQYC
jgi:hypothetical protein